MQPLCHDLAFIHKEEKSQQQQKTLKVTKRLGSLVKRKATRDKIQQNTRIFDTEKVKIYKSELTKLNHDGVLTSIQ